MCRLTAGFLGRYLDQPEVFRSGSPAWREKQAGKRSGFYGPGGFLATPEFVPENDLIRDCWNHHSWCEIDGLIVDLTLDQFDSSLPRVFIGHPDERFAANATRIEHQAAWLGGAYTTDVQLWLSDAPTAGLPTPQDILAELAELALSESVGMRA